MDRFWDKVDTLGECWEWTAATNLQGYGVFRVDGKNILAHRFVYSRVCEEIPEGMHICHHCDNPLCVKPSHLFMGTHNDNMQDAITKGRIDNRGEGNGRSKLCDDDVREIRRLHSLGIEQKVICEMWEVRDSMISRIVNRKNWRHV